MVLRKLTMALLSIGVMLPGLTHALAVRDIKTKSALGEPFRGEVELTDIGDLTEEDIKVGLAQEEDFARLGIERAYFLTELRFEVIVKEGRSLIKVSSNKRVTEPFLDFVIRVTWPNNTRLQQITTFLDPPVSVTQKETPVAPVIVERVAPIIAPVVAALPVPTSDKADGVVNSEGDNSYRVRKHDTLWNVARRVRPSAAVSVPTMMKVLHKANPDAFIANNINLLKDGKVLRVPTLMDIQSTSATAKVETRVIQPMPTNKPLARQQINATSSPKASLAVQKIPQAQMKLVAPTGGKVASAGSVVKHAKHAQSHTDKTVARSAVASKTIIKAAGYNQKLSQELATLEHQLSANDQKIAMQNAKLAQLEAQLKARRISAEQAAKHKNAEKAALEKKALATMVCAIATQSFLSTEAKAADPAPKEGGSMMPIIGGGLLVVIIAVIFFLKSKGKKAEPTKPVQSQAPAKPVPAAPKAPEVAQPKPAPVAPKKVLDPLEEVQPYLEMERFPQAVGILTKALVQAPDRADLHLKLLEIFVKQKDRQGFEDQYAKLEVLGELEAIVEAEKLKALLPAAQKVAVKGDSLEFERVAAKPVVKEEAESITSLEDLEKDFAMSLSQPNLKALDIEIRPDPVFDEPVVEAPKAAEIESLLDGGLEFSFTKEAKVEEPKPSLQEQSLNFSFDDIALDEKPAAKSFDTGLSLDSLDDFLAEHKTEMTPAIDVELPKVEAPALDFNQALASFKEETKEDELELNLTEGFELEEFNLGHDEAAKTDNEFEALDVDFSLDHPHVEAKSDFDLADIKTPIIEGLDFSEAAAAFDQETLPEEALEDDLDLDFDVSVSTDDVVADLDKEFSFLATTDENTTRLDLARAYMEMGDRMGARDLLEEVVAEGNGSQKSEAQGMLMRIG